jgi:hypothetical protein
MLAVVLELVNHLREQAFLVVVEQQPWELVTMEQQIQAVELVAA